MLGPKGGHRTVALPLNTPLPVVKLAVTPKPLRFYAAGAAADKLAVLFDVNVDYQTWCLHFARWSFLVKCFLAIY